MERGEEAPPPPESDIFKTETYSSFIFLFFKIATEINVFSHLGKMLMIFMKESLLGDKRDMSEENESQDEEDFESDDEEEQIVENTSEETPVEQVSESNSEDNFVLSIIEDILDRTFTSIKETEPKTVTSLYGKVYALKPSIKAL